MIIIIIITDESVLTDGQLDATCVLYVTEYARIPQVPPAVMMGKLLKLITADELDARARAPRRREFTPAGRRCNVALRCSKQTRAVLLKFVASTRRLQDARAREHVSGVVIIRARHFKTARPRPEGAECSCREQSKQPKRTRYSSIGCSLRRAYRRLSSIIVSRIVASAQKRHRTRN